MKNTDEAIHYIRKNKIPTAMIYLKDNDRKAAQKLFCTAYAVDCEYEIIGETTDIEEIKDCDFMIVSSASMITRDVDEYYNIERKLKKRGIEIEIALNDNRAGKYIDLALELYRKGRI